jgi:isopentenyl diphosphate isomerase/L-lactate dehydrogenase-like FMN-dependent dehydrogenase
LAEQNNYTALVLTVDAPVLGKREAEEIHKFKLPDNMKLEVFEQVAQKHNVNLTEVTSQTGSGLLSFFAS